MKINRTVQRALIVLDLVATAPKGLRLSELVEALEVPKSSLFDIVSTLVGMNYLREENKRFFIGIKTKEAGDRYGEFQDLSHIADSLLSVASEKYHSSTSLVRLHHNDLEYLFQYHPKDAVMVARQSSPYNILHASATGKVLMAFLDEDRKNALVRTLPLQKFTDRTIDSVDGLLEELDQVRENGYALDNREYHYLLQCVAAPILFREKCIAAISFSGLNLFNENPQDMLRYVKQTAREITEAYSRS